MTSIAAYILTTRDDTDVLVNAVRSCLNAVDAIWLCDTGELTAYHNPRFDNPTVLEFWRWAKYIKGWPVEYTNATAFVGDVNYSDARNRAGVLLADYDWIVMVDSDELLTHQTARGLRDIVALAERSSPQIVTIVPKWLTLYPDDQHYTPAYTGTLAHGRIYRPTKISWHNPIHEHQDYDGVRMEWDSYIIHCRQLFTGRCKRQRLHGGDAWKGISDAIRPVSELNVTWDALEYPKDDAADVRASE